MADASSLQTASLGAGRRTRPRVVQERSLGTRQRLLEATIECIVEVGYAGTSTTLIADRADVSRGAQQHHYPTKVELVVAAVGEVGRQADLAIRDLATRYQGSALSIDRTLSWFFDDEVLQNIMIVVAELNTASRTDPGLREAWAPLAQRMADGSVDLLSEVLEGQTADPQAAAVVTTTFLAGLTQASFRDDAKARKRRMRQARPLLAKVLALPQE
jgi:AcrR family transcriptional regulator